MREPTKIQEIEFKLASKLRKLLALQKENKIE